MLHFRCTLTFRQAAAPFSDFEYAEVNIMPQLHAPSEMCCIVRYSARSGRCLQVVMSALYSAAAADKKM